MLFMGKKVINLNIYPKKTHHLCFTKHRYFISNIMMTYSVISAGVITLISILIFIYFLFWFLWKHLETKHGHKSNLNLQTIYYAGYA